MRKTSVYLDEEQAKRVARLAREEGRSQAEILREAVASYQPKQVDEGTSHFPAPGGRWKLDRRRGGGGVARGTRACRGRLNVRARAHVRASAGRSDRCKRRGRDSNPRWSLTPISLSRRVPSATRPPLPKIRVSVERSRAHDAARRRQCERSSGVAVRPCSTVTSGASIRRPGRGGRAVECDGLENRRRVTPVSRVRIPPPPLLASHCPRLQASCSRGRGQA